MIHTVRKPEAYRYSQHSHQNVVLDCQRCGTIIAIGERYYRHKDGSRRKLCAKCFVALAYDRRRV